ncbi:hypothetical protein [Enterococcus pallens]|uniref:Uncharacterized protein n=1 Tax=Enterococcus pallens ATCC BAA-351 TaxID=1158607 RepID=R2SYQ7_9ENTE|nr:hypothetical protein [Enterococcus pallens]EOH93164.1 hypothetical protein UAU_02807 [Enterococcus pallens ATCC BAA-351]EOU24950.1 hypothetical protein I588_00938 [Enterococcus pallens ATCC BAA-351]OJG76493.1 hypothetical protein RV10_GL003734 [Enterococcus pallens]
MKSNQEQLQARGWIEADDLVPFQNRSPEELLNLLDSEKPQERSAAARLMPLTKTTTAKLLEAAANEKKLYCRLEIMRKLEVGTPETAKQMLPYLGEIGNNQHQLPLAKPSAKKSFPLPRDLIARSLGNMYPTILPTLFEQLGSLNSSKLSELIDAIGLLVFYHPHEASDEYFNQLLTLWDENEDNPLIQWKLIICFSAFPQSKPLLEEIIQTNAGLATEAQRSLNVRRST